MSSECRHTPSHDVAAVAGNCPACLLEMALTPNPPSTPSQSPTEYRSDRSSAGQNHATALRPLTPGTVVASRFRITALIGRGGMGEVYRADDLKLGQTIALKFLPAGSPDAAALERTLYEEVRVGRQVAHPNVCRIYDLLDIEGRPAVVMEFVDGEDLASLLKRIGRLSYAKALEVARDICSGVDAAHEKGIVHGDLKPGNIMIDGAGRARITDFGLSRMIGESGERLHAGTIAYMAPEQFQNGRTTRRTDIFALGAVLYELFSGRCLHSERKADAVAPPRRPSVDEPLLDPALEDAILRCIDREPASRPPSARAVLALIPGGDALDVAVAAGDTPSPDLVASSRKAAELSRRAAWTLLSAALAALAAVVVLSDRLTLYGRSQLLRSPEALAERARQLAQSFGYYAPARDEGYRFRTDLDQASISFHFMSSTTQLLPVTSAGRLRLDEPPGVGATNIVLSPSGRLLGLSSNVASRRGSDRPVTWEQVLTEAGIDPVTARPMRSEWRPPLPHDEKSEWRAGSATVRAALLGSRLVFFEVAPQLHAPDPRLLRNSPLPRLAYLIVLSASITAGGYLAWRNTRLKRVDQRAAWRVAAWTFVCSALYELLTAHHPLLIEQESELLAAVAGSAMLFSSGAWLAYAALEPYVRRHWPQTLVGWARIVHGRFRDPIVGRDLLVGASLGLLIRLLDQIRNVVPFVSSLRATPSHLAVEALSSTHEAVGRIFYSASGAIFDSLFALFLLVLLSRIFRNRKIAIVLWLLATTASWSRWDDPLIEVPLVAVEMGLLLFAVYRVGLLAAAGTVFVWLITVYVPLTPDPRAFYFPQSFAAVALIAALVVVGFRAALGGKPLFAGEAGEAWPEPV